MSAATASGRWTCTLTCSLSLGDGLCIATAERLDLPLTGGDRYWDQVDMTVPDMPFR